ncbi:MAG: ABC transporter ATP-binding protein [Deltaproteobacteria bacterium]|nr:ABC transporter ATP-binding protein [Deltaproteobacteria bacterium]
MRLLIVFARMYPWRSLGMLGCLLLAAVVEGLGLSTLLPLLSLATEADLGASPALSHKQSQLEQTVRALLATVNLHPTIGLLLLLVVLSMVLKATLVLLAQRQVGYTVAQVATDLRLGLIRAILAARWGFFVRQPAGTFANAFTTETSRAAHAYQSGATIVAASVETLLYVGIALTVSWQATLVAVIAGVCIVSMLHRFVRMTRHAGKRQTLSLKALLGRLADMLYAVKALKAMAKETQVSLLIEKETRRLNRALRREVFSKEVLKALQEPIIVSALAAGMYVALTYWAVPLKTLILMALLFGRAMASFSKVQKQYQQMVTGESAFWSLQDTIARSQAAREPALGATRPVARRDITLHDVSFSYDEHHVLRNVSLTIPTGQMTAIIGPSGAGKTSIVDLIVGLVRPQAGDVWLDDTPLADIDITAWRQRVGYVPQETLLLHDSIFVNITLGEPDITEADVETALRAAEAWDFIAALPEGIHTLVGERGSRFSGGQRQRIAIARALVHKPHLLILDEATASLDPVSEATICDTVRKLRGTTTILAVTHQPALLDVADLVYRLEHGVVQQQVLPQQAGNAATMRVA